MAEAILSKMTGERIYLHCPGAVLSMAVKLYGEVGEEAVGAALLKVLARHPLARSTVTVGADGQGFFAMNKELSVPVRMVKREKETQWRDVIHEEEAKPMDLFAGPPLRVILLEGRDASEIVFHWHRVLGDGPSLALFVRDFLKALGGETGELDELAHPAPIDRAEELDAKAPGRYMMSNLMRSNMNNAWGVEKKKAAATDDRAMLEKWRETAKSTSVGASLSAGRWGAVVERCQRKKLDPQSVLLTAFYKATFVNRTKKDRKKRDRLSYEADVRPYLKDPREGRVGSFSTVISLYYQYVPVKSFWENAGWLDQCVSLGMKEDYDHYSFLRFLLDTDPTLIDRTYPQFFGVFDSKASRTLVQLLGFTDLSASRVLFLGDCGIGEQYGGVKVQDVQLVPGVLPENRMALGAVGFKGKLNVNLAARQETMDYAALKHTLDGIIDPIEVKS